MKQTTNLERRTNEFKDLDGCKVIGVNTDTEAIRVVIMENDTQTREQIESMATDFFSEVTEVKHENGSVLLEIKEEFEETLPFE